ncbi:HAMP domain-containing protein [bacterium]|nr:HAMP domain-containing protein [bacterium]
MAWGTAIRKPERYSGRRRRDAARSKLWSPIAGLILASNLAGLIILIVGALVLNEIRSGLVQARTESLREQSDLIASVLVDVATRGDPEPQLLESQARSLLKRLRTTANTRMRIFNADTEVAADTYLLNDEVEAQTLPPIREPGVVQQGWLELSRFVSGVIERLDRRGGPGIADARSLEEEVAIALRGDAAASQRFSDLGERVISVSIPIRHVGAVVGALTVESSDVAEIIAAERAALLPFIFVAILVAIVTSALLTTVIARPLRRLSIASDQVRTGAADRLDLGKLPNRKDEIGDLAQALAAMTAALNDRIQANERFAADVAHELKNPLTSIRSAVETAQTVSDPAVRERMGQVIARDVIRLDRLITDISNLSRAEAEIMREKATRVDLSRLLEDLVSIYADTGREGEARVTLHAEPGVSAVMGREGPIGQVVRNLIDNARSFSPPGGEVRVTLNRRQTAHGPVMHILVDDDGPGVPPDKLEKIFERFYSDRPQGAKFGNNSGLGLSLVKQIVETHRGKVWAENRIAEGVVKGARFNVELPAVRGDT